MALSKKQIKIVEEMQRRVEFCDQFMKDWLLFNQILMAYPSPGANKTQLENQFLQIKSQLARRHNVLKETLGPDYQFDGNTMNIVSGATNLEAIYSTSEVAVKKLQNEWHRAFISINETLGALVDKKARAEAGEKVFLGVAPGEVAGGGGMSDGAKKGLIAAVVIIVIVVVLAFTPIGSAYVTSFKDLFGG